MFVVRAGETIPADGTITAGVATVDQHLLTGEARPAERAIGDTVFASTTLLSGSIHVQVERAGNETVVAQIGAILDRTADFKTTMQSRGEALADRMAPPFLAMGAVALPLLGPVGAGTCSRPASAAQRVLAPLGTPQLPDGDVPQRHLVKDGHSLGYCATSIPSVDKTGTLTLGGAGGRLHVQSHDENEVLRCAAAVEADASNRQPSRGRDSSLCPFFRNEARYEVGYGTARVGRSVRVSGADYGHGGRRHSGRDSTAGRERSRQALVCDRRHLGVIALQSAPPEAKRVGGVGRQAVGRHHSDAKSDQPAGRDLRSIATTRRRCPRTRRSRAVAG